MSTSPTPNPPKPGMFAEPTPERNFPTTAVAIAVVANADNLEVSNVEMSESGNLAGGKSTYVDGHVANKGDKTVTGVTVQVIFANDTGMPPQIETVPLNLVRSREPYIDIQPMSAAPLVPGGEADFRLIFENLGGNWNQQTPGLRAIQVSSK
jgi:hypothetical protein